MKIYIVGTANNYADFIEDVTFVNKIEDAEVVIFTGGSDVWPHLYDKKIHPRTCYNIARDREELEIFKKIRPDQLCVGVCRGLI